MRWERDVLRLERVVLQQAHSRYEVQGEYTIPPTADIPRSAASLALATPSTGSAGPIDMTHSKAGEAPLAAMGRWRVQVVTLCPSLSHRPRNFQLEP